MTRAMLATGLTLLVVGSSLFGCSTVGIPPPPTEIRLRVAPMDFHSNFGSGDHDSAGVGDWQGVLGVAWTGSLGEDHELMRRATEVIGGGTYLVELSSGALVPGRVEEGAVRLDGEVVPGWPDGGTLALGMISFVPDEPLADGWYVLVADLHEWITTQPSIPTTLDDLNGVVEDDMMFVRIRIGSGPVWYLSGVNCDTRPRGDRSTWCDAWAGLSESVESFGTTRFELRIGGELASDCVQTVVGGWQCPYYPAGTDFEIRLVESDVILPLEGITSQTMVGGGEAHPKPLISPRFGIDIARSAR